MHHAGKLLRGKEPVARSSDRDGRTWAVHASKRTPSEGTYPGPTVVGRKRHLGGNYGYDAI